MTIVATALIILSAMLHVGWNLISKRQNPSAAFFLIAYSSALILLPPLQLLSGHQPLLSIPSQVWWLLVLTSLFMAGYSIALAYAYRCGQMSIAYPIARALPVVLVALLANQIGHNTPLSTQVFFGSILVAGGCLLLPLLRFSELRPRHFINSSCAFAFLAALGTVGYSLIDYDALQILQRYRPQGVSILLQTLLYGVLQACLCSLWLALFVSCHPQERSQLKYILQQDMQQPLMAGICMHVGYLLVLFALTQVSNVSYVVSFRQLSIPLGAACAIVFLGEPASRPKLVGVAILLTGLMLVVTG